MARRCEERRAGYRCVEWSASVSVIEWQCSGSGESEGSTGHEAKRISRVNPPPADHEPDQSEAKEKRGERIAVYATEEGGGTMTQTRAVRATAHS